MTRRSRSSLRSTDLRQNFQDWEQNSVTTDVMRSRMKELVGGCQEYGIVQGSQFSKRTD